MKKALALFTVLCLIWGSVTTLLDEMNTSDITIKASAEIYGNYEYIILDDETVEISKYTGNDAEVIIPSEIDGYTVTSIGFEAFLDCKSLISVKIPHEVVNIGQWTFCGCSNLVSVDIQGRIETISLSMFNGCINLTNVTIPDSVIKIDEYAFACCYSLKSIDLPESITSIGVSAFSDCKTLKSIIIPSDVTSISDDTFYNCCSLEKITIPSSVTSIGECAFINCKNLANITIPESVTSIGKCAFQYCENLKSIVLPSKIKNIEFGTFGGCTNLANINISGVENIDEWAFSSIEGIECITLPESVISISDNAFASCINLKSITIPSRATNIGARAFQGCKNLIEINVANTNSKYASVNGVLYNKSKTELICCPEGQMKVTIPSSVTSIGYRAFSGCTNLDSIIIPNGVTSIGEYAFCCCTGLLTIELPNSVTNIGDYAFIMCYNLLNLDIPDGVINIGKGAFECSSLMNVTIPSSIKSIGDYAFYGCINLKCIEIHDNVTDIGDYALGYTFINDYENRIKYDNFVIICDENSTAKEYAIDNEIEYDIIIKEHNHTYDNWTTTKSATCASEGTQTRKCLVCGKTETKSIAKTTAHSYTAKVVPATTTAQGYTLHTCSVCGDSYKDNYKAKLTRTSIAKATVSGLSNKTYTGNAIKQTPVVKLGSKTLKSGTDYTLSYKSNKAVGTATVTITGKGAYTGTAKATFKITPKKTTLKSVTSPKTKQLKATYSKVSGVTGYQISYSTSSKFTKATTKTTNSTATSKTVSKLTKGKTYYVRVRTYKTVSGTKYYSGWSAVKKIKVK